MDGNVPLFVFLVTTLPIFAFLASWPTPLANIDFSACSGLHHGLQCCRSALKDAQKLLINGNVPLVVFLVTLLPIFAILASWPTLLANIELSACFGLPLSL